MLLRHAIGSALRRLRLQRGMTLRQLSESSRVSLPYLSEVERGRKEVSSEILMTICIVLGLSISDLLRETDVEFARSERPVLDIRSTLHGNALGDATSDDLSSVQRDAAVGDTLLLAA